MGKHPEFSGYETMASVWRRSGRNIGELELSNLAVDKYGISSHDGWRATCEALAFGDKRVPEFKVYPDIAMTLAHSRFDIKAKLLAWPFDFFLVSLPVGNPLRCHNATSEVLSILCGWNKKKVHFLTQTAGIENRPDKPTSQFRLVLDESRNLEEQILEHTRDASWEDSRCGDDNDLAKELIGPQTLAWVRICVGVALLATSSDKLIEGDVLSKDFLKYIEAKRHGDDTKCGKLEDRCQRRRGGKVFTVGRTESMRTLYSKPSGGDDGAGRQLSHQHLRRAHFRVCHTGKVIFIRHTIVRPDLPASTQGVAYNLS